MVYNNRQYNTRNSGGGRYNSGQFVAAGPQQHQQHQQQQQQQQQPQQQQQFAPPPPPPPQPAQYPTRTVQTVTTQPANSQPQQFPNKLQEGDIDMKEEPDADAAASEDSGASRPPWMKSKLPGVKKISKKEKRRRQNAHLRRLITPKNALMVLNEMMLHDQLANNFKVEAAETPNQYYKTQKNSFCADLTLDGVSYKGYGGNKLIARNAAAEQAIRDLIIKRMQKAVSHDLAAANSAAANNAANNAAANSAQGANDESQSGGEEEDPLPMIQLASFALHKLFSEWEYEGHKVPQLKPPSTSMSEGDTESMSGAGGGVGAVGASPPAPRVRSAKKPKELPAGAGGMHPCMLLTYMRPHLEYRELAVDGDRPQAMVFTMGVDVDGATYIGKASNKKEARKNAARAACSALFGVQFDDPPANSAPMATA